MNVKYLVFYISLFVPVISMAHSGDYKPVEFVKNEGQWDGPFVYRAEFGNINVFLEQTAFTYLIGDKLNSFKMHEYKFGKVEKTPLLKYHAYKVRFINANENAEITGSKPRSHYYNYFLGSDTSKWKSFVYPELNVDYKDFYQGIDLHVASENNNIKYDLIVHPGANPDLIAQEFDGVDDIRIKDKNLIIKTSVGEVAEMAPYAFQYINSSRVEVPCKYVLEGNKVTYKFPKGYDHSTDLIIDPTVEFSTFTGSTSDNWGFTATYDNAGNFYAGGIVNGTGYPRTIGPTYKGGDGADSNGTGPNPYFSDIAITKFNTTGNTNVYSTYIGGVSQDQPHSMVVDNNGNLFISGRTYSVDYPSTNGSSPAGGADIIVTKLDNSGTLTASGFMGGSKDDGVNVSSVYGNRSSLKHSYADDARSEILVDNTGNIYVASCTKSSNFPTSNAIKNTLTGFQDGVVFKMNNSLTNLIWSTYLGGNREDAAYVLAFSPTQSSVYVSGGTASQDFPVAGNPLWSSYNGGITDGFITKFENSGSYSIQSSTYIGRGDYDQCFGIQTDDAGNVYVMGNTFGGTFPVTAGVYSNPNSSQFVMKLDSDLSNNLFSTVYGSGNSSDINISPVAFLVDTCDNIYISGWGGATTGGNGTTNNMPVKLGNPAPTPAGVLKSQTDGSDFYFIVLSRNASALLFGAYYGGQSTSQVSYFEHVDGGTSRFNENGEIYQAICGGCGGLDIPTTNGVFSPTNGSSNCNLLALKIAFNLGAVEAKAAASPNAVVCLGDPIFFNSNGSANVQTYFWDFGDGNTSSSANPTHTYNTGGTFNVLLATRNPDACVTDDTALLVIRVDTNSIKADFDVIQTDSCNPYIATFTNTSKYGNPPGSASFFWTFGDGTSFSGAAPVPHTYSDTGTYTITLIMNDPNACNAPDTITKTISFNNSFVKADFDGPSQVCVGEEAAFNNKSTNALSFGWTFGDGNGSSDQNPTYVFDSAGIFTVRLRSINTNTCNGIDSLDKQIEVLPVPTASFSHQPIIPETNEPVIFTNYSTNATSFIWTFGDGTGSDLRDPRPKSYNKTGTYKVCLQALNSVGCSDTVCRNVDADVFPLADVPTGFSPNGDGENEVLYVRGYGITTLDFRVYNRWGELVFETSDQSIGWDGTYNGAEQPAEAYAYVLHVEFIDGVTFNKSGNVTLLR